MVADRTTVVTIVVMVMETGVVAAENVVAGGGEEEVGIKEGKVATVTATTIMRYVFLLLLANFSLITRFLSSEVLRDAAVLQDTVRDQDHPLDGTVPDLTLQDRGVDLVLIRRGRAHRKDAVTSLHHLGVVDTAIVQGHALGLHMVTVGEDVLHFVGEVGLHPRQGLPEVGTPASDAVATLLRSTLPALDHLPGVPLSKIAVGLGRRPGPCPGQGHPLGRGKCAVHLHLASVLAEVRAWTHARGHRTCVVIDLGAALLGFARKNPGPRLRKWRRMRERAQERASGRTTCVLRWDCTPHSKNLTDSYKGNGR